MSRLDARRSSLTNEQLVAWAYSEAARRAIFMGDELSIVSEVCIRLGVTLIAIGRMAYTSVEYRYPLGL